MKPRTTAALVAFLIAVAGALGWANCRARPSLDGVERLVARGKYADADARLESYLAEYPGQDSARFLLAQICLDRPDPKPRLALEQIAAIHTSDRGLSAQLRLMAGRAWFLLNHLANSEAAYKEGLRLDPHLVEAGWGLLNQYSLQDRFEDARRLGLTLYESAPDLRGKVQALLAIVHFEVTRDRVAAGARVPYLEEAVAADPSDRASAVALGSALVRDGKVDGGLALLRKAASEAPNDSDVRQTYLRALSDAGEIDLLGKALDGLGPPERGDPLLDDVRGNMAQARGDWKEAAQAYARAWEARPADTEILYRLVRATRTAGGTAEAARLEARRAVLEAARLHVRQLYDQASADPGFGTAPNPDFYRAMGEALETLGRRDEAQAWRRL
jgi:tetratricopeptide (TPR) repeat protein